MPKIYCIKRNSEDAIQQDFFDWLKLNAARFPLLELFFAVPNGGYRHLTTAMRLKKTGVQAGIPDTFLPVGNNGFFGLWIEFKTEKGTLQDSQKRWLERLKAQNYAVYVCRSWNEAAQTTIDYLGLPIKV